MNDVMIDIETIGTTPGDVILSIGAAQFDINTGKLGAEYYCEIDVRASSAAGFTINGDTLMWWLDQSPEARKAFFGKTKPSNAAMDFRGWCTAHATGRIWTQGDMDLPMIAALFKRHGMSTPWKFWNYRDTRTAYEVCRFDPRSVKRDGTYHNALDDVEHQIVCLTTALANK